METKERPATPELCIKENHLEVDLQELQFCDELPVVAAYLRNAAALRCTETDSAEAHLNSIRHACNEKFGENAFHLIAICDEGCSGNLPWKQPGLEEGQYRPGLTLITKMIENGLINCLAIYTMYKLTRDMLMYLTFVNDYLIPHGIELICATERAMNTGTGYQSPFQRLSAIAEQRFAHMRSVVREGQKARVDVGYPLGKPGYGWIVQDRRYVPKGRHAGIEPVAEQAEIVRRMFQWYLSGKGLNYIARKLTEDNILFAWRQTVLEARCSSQNPVEPSSCWFGPGASRIRKGRSP